MRLPYQTFQRNLFIKMGNKIGQDLLHCLNLPFIKIAKRMSICRSLLAYHTKQRKRLESQCRNISRLTPANYYAKVYAMAMRAMRRDTVKMIFNGDGQSTNDMFGIKTAKNVAGNAIYATKELSAVDADLLTELMFAYGGDEMLGGSCRLYLNKADLLALGKIRGTNEKRRLFDIVPDAGNPNTGTIREGGTIVPYSIASNLTALSGSSQGSAAIQTMVYGDPMNYELGLFGDYTVRVDESVKAVERMLTILGDAMVGGNLIVDKGFVVATLPKTSG